MQHEVVSLSEKVVLKAEDVIGWMRAAVGVKWDTGLLGVYGPPSQDPANDAHYTPPISGALDIGEIMREKKLIGELMVTEVDRWVMVTDAINFFKGDKAFLHFHIVQTVFLPLNNVIHSHL